MRNKTTFEEAEKLYDYWNLIIKGKVKLENGEKFDEFTIYNIKHLKYNIGKIRGAMLQVYTELWIDELEDFHKNYKKTKNKSIKVEKAKNKMQDFKKTIIKISMNLGNFDETIKDKEENSSDNLIERQNFFRQYYNQSIEEINENMLEKF